MSTYVFDQAWQRERDRLRSLERLFGAYSRRSMSDLGVGPGWRCLEVGCGAGGVALWLADQVGQDGKVVATDLDTRFVDGHGRDNLEVLVHDVVTDPLADSAFDLIHARAVLEHVADRETVLRRLVAALKPGGWLLVEDVDFGDAAGDALARYFDAPDPTLSWAFPRVFAAVAAAFVAIGADPAFGPRLPGALTRAGLIEIGAELHTPVVRGGTEDFVRGTLEQLADRLAATGLVTRDEIDRALTVLADPATFYVPPLMVSAWGRRPDHS